MSAPAPALDVADLVVRYGSREVVHGLDLRVRSGQLVALLGANGSGKSTTLRAIAGLTPAASGTMAIEGHPRGHDASAVAMVFQGIDLVGRYSALDNACSGGLARLSAPRSLTRRGFPRALREEAMGCLEAVGMAEHAHTAARRLSGGQAQRVAVARALCQRPAVLLADEPVAALDPAAAEQVMTLLHTLAASTSIAVLAVLHQPGLALRHADRVVGMVEGRIGFDAPATDLDAASLDALYAPRPAPPAGEVDVSAPSGAPAMAATR